MLRNAPMGKRDLQNLRVQAKHNIERLLPHVESGAKILVLNPTCSMMMRKEYVELLDGADKENAQKVADATMGVANTSGLFVRKSGSIRIRRVRQRLNVLPTMHRVICVLSGSALRGEISSRFLVFGRRPSPSAVDMMAPTR